MLLNYGLGQEKYLLSSIIDTCLAHVSVTQLLYIVTGTSVGCCVVVMAHTDEGPVINIWMSG